MNETRAQIAKLEWREDQLRGVVDNLQRAGHPDIADDVCRVADEIAYEMREMETQAELAEIKGNGMSPESVAQRYHEACERLAQSFGNQTLQKSTGPWTELPEPDRSLMIAAMAIAIDPLLVRAEGLEKDNARLQKTSEERMTEIYRLHYLAEEGQSLV